MEILSFSLLPRLVFTGLTGIALFGTALIRDMFQGDDKDSLKEIALNTLFATLALLVFQIALQFFPQIAWLGNLYTVGVIWVCFQLEDMIDYFFFGAIYGFMTFLVQAPILHFLSEYLG
jgi:hypothetical protein